MRKNYSTLSISTTIEQLILWAIEVTRERQIDLSDYNNQVSSNPVIFSTVPASSTDTIGTEKVGDIAVDSGFLYVVVDNAGTLEWRRVAIASF